MNRLERLENDAKCIRNVCILAHIDHGKTSLSDCLVATNGIISQQHQGEIRYLDSRPDEQERGITMESSAISLYFKTIDNEFVVNLIDSPGHVDFSSEVTQASRLCDAAILVVDALEGVCSQTVNALKQAWDEELKSVLVINKIDKLYEDWHFTSSEASQHLVNLVEQVNAVWGQLYVGKRMETEEDNDDIVYFSPANNNVVFASALQGYGFSIQQFAAIYEKKLGVERQKLAKFLWGNYFLDPKTKKVSTVIAKNKKTMFTQFIMDSIWAVYQAVDEQDSYKVDRIVQALNLKPVNGDNVKQIFHQWIPVSRAIMSVIINLPSPVEGQKLRTDNILLNTPNSELIDSEIKTAMENTDVNGPCLSYISKIISVPESSIPKNVVDKLAALRLQSERLTKEDNSQQITLGFGRIYSGEFKVGMEIDLLSPKYDPERPEEFRSKVKIDSMFLFMGRDLLPITRAGPGAIVGFGGLDGIVKSGTLVSPGIVAPNLARSARIAAPILRVAIEPKDPTKLDIVEHGLELLNIADPSVEFEISELGEFILSTSGELHLEKCLHDLENSYAKVELDVSQPIVPFKETIKQPRDGEDISMDVGGCHLVLNVEPWDATQEASEGSEASQPVYHGNTINTTNKSVLNGFKAAMKKGPLLEEPVQGVKVNILELSNESHNSIAQRRLISATKKAIHLAMEQWSPRIMLAMYLCEIQASTDVLGRLYGVITRRHGRILTEELKEGTPFFQIRAVIPVIESMGFSEEIRKKTSGAANPQLVFNGFEQLDEDPFWVPTTEEELEDLGEIADRENLALSYVNQIRRRKGLKVTEKLVDNSERDREHRH